MGIISQERVQFEAALAALLAEYGGGAGTISVTRQNVINLVKAKLDELIPEAEGLTFSLNTQANVTNPLDLLISALLDEAAKNTLMMAPFHILEPLISEELEGTPDIIDGLGETGYVTLAENFLRLISFKMVEWDRPVNIPIQNTTAEYFMQKNKYIRGGVSKPVVSINWKVIPAVAPAAATKVKVLEYYSVPVDSDHAIDHLLYIQETVAEDVQSNLQDVLTWICAAKILQITGLNEAAQKAMEQVALSLNNL